jgi:hypothetical protein
MFLLYSRNLRLSPWSHLNTYCHGLPGLLQGTFRIFRRTILFQAVAEVNDFLWLFPFRIEPPSCGGPGPDPFFGIWGSGMDGFYLPVSLIRREKYIDETMIGSSFPCRRYGENPSGFGFRPQCKIRPWISPGSKGA